MHALARAVDCGDLNGTGAQPLKERQSVCASECFHLAHARVADYNCFLSEVIDSESQVKRLTPCRPVGIGDDWIGALPPENFRSGGTGYAEQHQQCGAQQGDNGRSGAQDIRFLAGWTLHCAPVSQDARATHPPLGLVPG